MRRISIIRPAIALALAISTILASGQGCQVPSGPVIDPPPDFSVITSCGLSAVECVPLAGSSPYALAVGDLNGTGLPDLVSVNFGADNLTILLNNGDGTLTSAGNKPTANSPLSAVLGDFDNDGLLDIAAGGGFYISLFYNQGGGRFSSPARINMDYTPTNLAAADFNGDGHIDLASANGAYDTITIFINDGEGRFTLVQDIRVSLYFVQVNGLIAADFNGDGWPDLAASHRFSGNVSVLLNDGEGHFTEQKTVTVKPGHLFNALNAGDLNGDGLADLIVADNGDPFDEQDPGGLQILFNIGGGDFAPPGEVAAGDSPAWPAIVDLDGDGANDLAVANNVSGNVSLMLNDGKGAFTLAENVTVGAGPSFVAPADLDGDGFIDLAVANFTADTISVLLNDGTGSFSVSE